MGELSEIPGMKNIRNGSVVKRWANAKVAKFTLDNEIQNEIITSMTKLKEQNTLSIKTFPIRRIEMTH